MPFNPGNSDRSGEIFGNLVSNGLNNLARGIEDYGQAKKREADNAKVASAFVSANPEALPAMGFVNKDHFDTLSARDKSNVVQGYITSTKLKEIEQQNQQRQQQIDQQAGDAQLLRNLTVPGNTLDQSTPRGLTDGVKALSPAGARMLADARFNRLATDYQAPQPLPSVLNALATGGNVNDAINNPTAGMPLSAEKALQFARQAGLPVNDQFQVARGQFELSRAQRLDRQDQADSTAPLTFSQDPTTGARFAIKGKQVIPSGVDPAALRAPQATPVLDSEGNPTDQMVIPHPNGKGFTLTKPPVVATSVPELDIGGVPTGRLRMQLVGDPEKVQAYIDRHNANRNDPNSASDMSPGKLQSSVVAQPKTQADVNALAPGQMFINPRDGKTYVKK